MLHIGACGARQGVARRAAKCVAGGVVCYVAKCEAKTVAKSVVNSVAERRESRAPFMLVATVLFTSFFALFGLPILIQMLLKALQMLALGYQANLYSFVEGLVLTCLLALQIIGFIYFLTCSLLRAHTDSSPRRHDPRERHKILPEREK